MQYTIRHIPGPVDNAIRERARVTGKSLNEVVFDMLVIGSRITGTPHRRRDLSDIAGTWKADRAVQSALVKQHRVDKDLWH